jgi:hypothetical protein
VADALLQRQALLCRAGDGLAPRELAGIFVDHGDVERILRTLPGLDGPGPTDVSGLLAVVDPLVERAADRFRSWLPDGDEPLAAVTRSARLDTDTALTLALLAAVELHPDRQRLVMYIQDSINLPRLTHHWLGRILPTGAAALDSLCRGGSLHRARLTVEVGNGPWSARMVGTAPRLAWHLAAATGPDPDLPIGCRMVEGPAGGDTDLILVPGADRTSRHRQAMRSLPGPRFLVTPLPCTEAGWDALIREATVTGCSVIVDVDGDLSALAAERIDETSHLHWGLCSPTELPVEALPRRQWREVRPHGGRDHEQLRLTAAARHGLGGDASAAVRRLARGHLEGLAVRIPPRRTWSDIVAHPEQLAQLSELACRYRNRHVVYETWGFRAVPSAGLVAVFAGPSGTGKTLAAEVVAGDLGLDLYKIDLSSVVSKYIGETEKNLERIFGAASTGNVVLLFDEADSLFGKRSEVSDAHDRYANIEVSYLLQRLETYDGLVILATNLQRNMDQAFLRRIHVAVEFAVPDEPARRAIWALSFPPSAPTASLDLDFLARQFQVSGGSIRNAAVGAAFLAAGSGQAISMELVVLALKRELQKLGRLLTEDEFGCYFELVTNHSDTPMAVPS